MRIHKDEVTPRKALLIYPVPNLLEVCGWVQVRVARENGLAPVHLTFLRHAARQGNVSFHCIGDSTGLPRYAVSRAAGLLQKRRLGQVTRGPDNHKLKRFHINLAGLKLIQDIDLEFAKLLFKQGGESVGFKEHYNFAFYLWKAVFFFHDPTLKVKGRFVFPGEIAWGAEINDGQKMIMDWIEELLRRPGPLRPLSHD